MKFGLLAAVVLLAGHAIAATRISVTVVERKTGRFVEGLKAGDFTVLDNKTPRAVEAVEMAPAAPMDVVLMLDTSLAGPAVQPVAASMIGQLQDKDQMAVVGFHSAADLVQDFTSSRQLLMSAVGQVKFGNTPRVVDALSAVIRDGFSDAVYRKTVLLLTTGLDAGSRETERDVVKAARRSGVSIYPVYMSGMERGLFEMLARETGGATFQLGDLKKAGVSDPGQRVFETMRKSYVVTVAGNLSLGEKLKVEVRTPQKVFVSALPLE